jgi:two-component system, chemotaxis family, chemotaxis protein CheY
MSKTVLTVDDSSSIRQMVGFTLRGAGFEVIEARDGRDALTKLEQLAAKVHLVITDLNMPVMDGIALLKTLRAPGPYRFLPVLVLTTESQDARKQEARAAGATGWIVKPFRPEQLISTVKKVLG